MSDTDPNSGAAGIVPEFNMPDTTTLNRENSANLHEEYVDESLFVSPYPTVHQHTRRNSHGGISKSTSPLPATSTYSYSSYTDDDLNLPPGRMNATRVPERLSGSISNLPSLSYGGIPSSPRSPSPQQQQQLQQHPAAAAIMTLMNTTGGSVGSLGSLGSRGRKDGMTPRTGSRSRSPMVRGGTGGGSGTPNATTVTDKTMTATTQDANSYSSISSLEDVFDQDLLYDRAGMADLDADTSSQQRRLHGSRDKVNLPPVTERMCEDSLEDVHAFSNVVMGNMMSGRSSSNASRVSAGTGNDAVLEPLDELSEEDDFDNDEVEDMHPAGTAAVILTNMENLHLSAPTSAAGANSSIGVSGAVSRTGESAATSTAHWEDTVTPAVAAVTASPAVAEEEDDDADAASTAAAAETAAIAVEPPPEEGANI